MQTEGVAGTEEDGYAINVEGIAETLCDGFDERSDLGKVAGLVGEFGEELLGGVGFAEEALVDLLLETLGESEAEDEEDDEDAEDADDVDVALMARVSHEVDHREGQPDGEKDSQNVERLAREGVARALTDENANVDGAVDDDDVGEGQGKEQKDEERGKDDPSRDVLAHILTADDGDHEEDEKRCKPGGGTVVLPLALMLRASVIINVALAVFNLLPLPPLDGGRVVTGLLPLPAARSFARIERYGFLILLLLLYTNWVDRLINPIINTIAGALL